MSAWTEEYAPASLAALGLAVRNHFGLAAVAIGIKGDESHTFGYHRSRNWINAHGDGSGDYSNQLALDRAGDPNWLAALDISLPPDQMRAVSGRLLRGMRDGNPRLAAVREFYGTVDGENVIGWDSSTNRAVSSDDSHLWHVHISFYRSLAANDHSGVLAVLLGQEADDMDPVQDFRLKLLFDNWAPANRAEWTSKGGDGAVWDQAVARGGAVNMNALAHVDTKARIDDLKATVASTKAELAGVRAELAEIKAAVGRIATGGVDVQVFARAVNDEFARRQAE